MISFHQVSSPQLGTYRSADKSLARQGRKQATTTKLLTFASHSKTIQKVVRPTRSPRQQWPPLRTKKWRTLNCFFSRVGLRTYQHPCISLLPHTATCSAHSTHLRFDDPKNIWPGAKFEFVFIMLFCPVSSYLLLFRAHYPPEHIILQHPQPASLLQCERTSSTTIQKKKKQAKL